MGIAQPLPKGLVPGFKANRLGRAPFLPEPQDSAETGHTPRRHHAPIDSPLGLALAQASHPRPNRPTQLKAAPMQDNLQPLIHKAPVTGLRVSVTRTGLCINDPAELRLLSDGQIAIFAMGHNGFLGQLRPKCRLHLGTLGPAASSLILPAVQDDRHLRVRIVDLVPEHLAPETGPEVWISVWGDANSLLPFHLGPNTQATAAKGDSAAPPDQPVGRA